MDSPGLGISRAAQKQLEPFFAMTGGFRRMSKQSTQTRARLPIQPCHNGVRTAISQQKDVTHKRNHTIIRAWSNLARLGLATQTVLKGFENDSSEDSLLEWIPWRIREQTNLGGSEGGANSSAGEFEDRLERGREPCLGPIPDRDS